ncbi:MAG: hypothetical protein OJF49_003477 [Ktedonobacterales bacterium]|nr:MAG: hypothetical protein OJF49_003477 [Ktedonobacterales bacterium]
MRGMVVFDVADAAWVECRLACPRVWMLAGKLAQYRRDIWICSWIHVGGGRHIWRPAKRISQGF